MDNTLPAIGKFITIPAWRIEGMVIAIRTPMYGSDNAIEVLLETQPEDPTPRWYHLEPGQYTQESR